MSFEVPKSLLCPSWWDWILPVEFYFSIPEAQRGKVTCLRFRFVSDGARDQRKSPRELGGKSDSIWPSTADEGSPGHLWHLQHTVVLEQAVLCPGSLALSALAYSWNPQASQPARVSSSSEVLQRSPQARSQLDVVTVPRGIVTAFCDCPQEARVNLSQSTHLVTSLSPVLKYRVTGDMEQRPTWTVRPQEFYFMNTVYSFQQNNYPEIRKNHWRTSLVIH